MEWESIGFFLAAFYNLNILVVSWCLTDNKFHDHDTSFFSREQCILVCLWGAAYGTMATEFTNAPYICAVFGVEKVFFFRHWYRSLLTRGLPDPAMAKVIISALFRWFPLPLLSKKNTVTKRLLKPKNTHHRELFRLWGAIRVCF